MSNSQDLQEWFEQWRADKPGWAILKDLAALPEAELRNVLRPHEEAETRPGHEPKIDTASISSKVSELREELDKVLDAFTYLEIGFQLGALESPQTFPAGSDAYLPEQESFLKLSTSEAFLRYTDVYLFFGIRFLLARIDATPEAQQLPVDRDTNLPGKLVVKVPKLKSTPLGLLQALQQLNMERSEAEKVALNFLDGFRQKRDSENADAVEDVKAKAEEEAKAKTEGECFRDRIDNAHQPYLFELWLRGLMPELDGISWVPNDYGLSNPCIVPGEFRPEQGNWFHLIAEGLESWATKRAKVYLCLRDTGKSHEPAMNGSSPAQPLDFQNVEALMADPPKGGWRCDTPANARLALADLYWLAGILRADVSPRGVVSYPKISWLGLLRARAALHCDREKECELQSVEEILRLVFSIACELIQNAAELRDERDQLQADPEGPYLRRNLDMRKWRYVLDWEMHTIERQRMLRDYSKPTSDPTDPPEPPLDRDVWSERLMGGKHERNLIGLAFSGGGIRSATFNLGVLQGLQELDLLRQVDYLSTVSGGGYIGAWLVGNVRRARYWLGSMAPWEQSIRHLRAYSNYLAPRTGILSMDTWSLGALWFRNTILIQLTAFAWLLTAFTGVYAIRKAFLGAAYRGSFQLDSTPSYVLPPTQLIAILMAACVLSMMLLSFVTPTDKEPEVKRRWAVCPALLASVFVLAEGLWFALSKMSYIPDALHSVIREASPGSLYRILTPTAAILASCVVLFVILTKLKSGQLAKLSRAFWIHWLAVLPASIGSGIVGAKLFAISIFSTALPGVPPVSGSIENASFIARAMCYAHPTDYSTILLNVGWRPEIWSPVLVLSSVGFFLLALMGLYAAARATNSPPGAALSPAQMWSRLFSALGITLVCTAVLHLCFSAIVLAELRLQLHFAKTQPGMDNIGFLATPSLVLLSYTLAVLLMIGLSGRFSNEPQREWWTRLGGWIVVYALLGVLIPGAVFGGPWLIAQLLTLSSHVTIAWGGVIAWLGTVISGLFAGKSSKTSDTGASKSPSLEVLAKVAGLLFLIGAALFSAEVLFLFFQALVVPPHPGASLAIALTPWVAVLYTGLVLGTCGVIFSALFDINIFGLNQLYRNRLVRCFLGASRWRPGMRSPEPFTRFDFADDLKLSDFGPMSPVYGEFRGPIPLVNCSLNLGGSADLALHTRHSASFTFSPLFCGTDRPNVGYALTDKLKEKLTLGQAISISGAAASPNMGYNTSPLVAFLLTMFNVRLGWWIPNPGRDTWSSPTRGLSLPYLLQELAGEANESRKYINLSDGGHFENLGIYELVRRGCKVIIVGDAECDESMEFGGLANAIRLCATDFGAVIDLDVSSLRRQHKGDSLQHAAVGTIKYSNGSIGRIIYLKASITGDEDVTVKQYRSSFPSFPHQSTADQFFSEDQFESYRRLGRHVVQQSFRGIAPGEFLVPTAEQLADVLTPAFTTTESFLRNVSELECMWQRIRSMLQPSTADSFFSEVMGLGLPAVVPALTTEVTCAGLELLQLMENVFTDLRLDDFWEHPDNRGWAMLFMNWARSPRLRLIWKGNHRTFGMRFEYFCNRRLGLFRDKPVMRVSPLAQG